MPGRKSRKLRIVVNGKELESVTQFCYLGNIVIEVCRSECEIRRRIALVKKAFNKKTNLACGQWISQPPAEKKRIVKAFVWSITLYGNETWTLQKSDIKSIEAFKMWIWRRMFKISWTEHNKNDKVLKQLKQEGNS